MTRFDGLKPPMAAKILAWLSDQGWIQPLGPTRTRPPYQRLCAEALGWDREQVSDLIHGKLSRLGWRRLEKACEQIDELTAFEEAL